MGDTFTSSNWSGIILNQASVKEVFSDWNIPCYDTSYEPTTARAVQWVGMGGWGSSQLWQAGTESDPIDGERIWWEDFPIEPMQYVANFPANCGDHMAGQVDYGVSCINQSFAEVDDYTKARYWSSGCHNFTPDRNTGEWIDERTSDWNTGCLHSLANFRYTGWTYSQAEVDSFQGGQLLGFQSFSNWNFVDMWDFSVTPNVFLSGVSALGADGKSFTDSWNNFGNGC